MKIRNHQSRRAGAFCLVKLFAAGLVFLKVASTAVAQDQQPWFGVQFPPPLSPNSIPVALGVRGPAPAVVPSGELEHNELRGERIFEDVERIVQFSWQSREEEELGGDQLWGRVSGFPSSERTVRWAADELSMAGIGQIRVQEINQESDASLWLPEQWEVRLLGSESFGKNSLDIILETAMALAPSELPQGTVEAQIVYVGKATPAELMHIDVAGKIAIQHVTPQAHLVFERGTAVPAARSLFEAGALAVLNLIDQPGNERVRDFSNCGGPCFNLGGQDSRFLLEVFNRAVQEGKAQELRMKLSLTSRNHSGLSATNAIAIIPGQSNKTIILNAHADAWFDGAGDNADGLAVMLALARHFASQDVQLNHTLVFVVSAGHHTSGLNGPRNAVRMNPDLFDNAMLIFNLEHVAQRNIAPARFLYDDGYRQFTADSYEAPIVVGITNESRYLQELFTKGVARYGTNFMSTESSMASGEGGGYRSTSVPIVTTMQAPPLYHTSGEVAEIISVPGLERMARFMAFFVSEVDKIELQQLDTDD